MLLCIEMAIFSVLHLFAFNWKEYTTKQNSTNPGSEGGYKGGPLGVRAFFDAFNLWDLVKASARGFYWLFVGRRTRMKDSSYNPTPDGPGHLAEPDTTYHGPAHDGYDKVGGKPDNSQPAPSAEERLELLNHAQPAPVSPIGPDSLPIKNPEPSMIAGFSEPPRQGAVYPTAHQHDHKPAQTPPYPREQQYSHNPSYNPKPKSSSQAPYPDNNPDPFTDTPPGRFSYDEGPERLNHPGETATGSGRRQSPPRQHQEPWSSQQQQLPYP
jgi:hypothetical protein